MTQIASNRMPLRQTNYLRRGMAGVAASLLLLIAGCSDSDSTTDGDDMAPSLTTISISATGTQEIPVNDSVGSATGTLRLDAATGALTGTITTDITVSASHFHEGIAGTNGEVVLQLDVNDSTISVPESTILTADQIQTLLSGSYYINIHSAEFPGGELRDQIAPAGIEVVQVALSGANEVPPVETAASGTGYVTLDSTTGAMQVVVHTTGLITPSASHIHTAAAGETGDVLLPLTQDEAEVGNFAGSVSELSAGELESVMSGDTYINVHSAEVPSGELRGQIEP